MDNATKHKIIDRLHDSCSICSYCQKRKCGDSGNRELPPKLPLDDVLRAINLDEYFFKEPPNE